MKKNSKWTFINGKNYEAGILLTVLGLLFIFSLLFSFRLSNQKFENQMRYNLQEYYEAKSLRNLTVAAVAAEFPRPVEPEVIVGEMTYNLGTVEYQYTHEQIFMTVELNTGKIMVEIETLPVAD